ncbi:MAG: RimK family alpha-L-glutamate ligase [Planctomycetota bacterium]
MPTNSKRTVVFATCLEQPDLQPDDVPIAAALQQRGARVVAAAWNGPFAPFAAADLVAVRSTWDYQQAPDAFLAWLDRLDREGARVVNEPRLMRWNADKSYLLDLAKRGAPLPPTRRVEPDASAIAAAMDELSLAEAVVKPLFGAGASGLSIVRRDDPASLDEAAERLGGGGLLQPLLAEIRTLGETSLTFFAGEFSHAVVKRPEQGSILVQAEHGGATVAVEAAAAQLVSARAVLAMLPELACYARLDFVFGERTWLMEVEVIEPELFVLHGEGAADRCAEALLRAIRSF